MLVETLNLSLFKKAKRVNEAGIMTKGWVKVDHLNQDDKRGSGFR